MLNTACVLYNMVGEINYEATGTDGTVMVIHYFG